MFFKLTDYINMHKEPSQDSELIRLIPQNAVVQKFEESGDGEWLQVLYRSFSGITNHIGWLPKRFLTETEMPARPDFTLWAFLKSCVTAELWINDQADTPPHYVSADYLIALANIESKIKNIGEKTEGSGLVGPFQMSAEDWKIFTDNSGTEIYDEHDRDDPLDQIFGQAFLVRNDIKAISTAITEKLKTTPGVDVEKEIGPFIPSLVDVFLAHIAGVESAVELRLLKINGQGDVSITDILSKYHNEEELNQLLKHRYNFLKKNASEAETTDGMYVKIEIRLDKELSNAFKLIKEHAPEDLPITTGDASWMTIARKHQEIWQDTSVTETSTQGKNQILEYFSATDLATDKVLAWCGAFAAYCMKNAGAPVSDTVIAGASWAANWKKWGNVDIPKGTPLKDIPEGAVVVMSKSPGTAGSGHVGFFTRPQTGGALIELLGGNQSDRVKLKNFSPSKVAAIRWFSNDAQSAKSAGDAASTGNLVSLLDFIGKLESNNNYNAYFSKANNTNNPTLTEKTLNEVIAWQKDFIRRTRRESAAAGKYQIITKTLKGLISGMKLSGSELFDEEMQNRMAITLLKRRKLGSFLAGKLSKEDFANNLAKEWASLPMVNGPKKGRSYYAGVGSNKSLVKVDVFLDAISEIA